MTTIPDAVIKAAQAAQVPTGIPASVTIAQWAVESAWGMKCTGENNYFGIKAVEGQASTMCPTHEVVGGQRVAIMAPFANYDTMGDAFLAHAKLLTGPRYSEARACLPDAIAFVAKMAPVYATDPNYTTLLTGIIQGHNLTQYDVPSEGA